MEYTKETKSDPVIEQMFSVGAHYGYSRSRRHPSVKPFIFGAKNRVDIFDLEKTKELLEQVREVGRNLGKEGKQVLFVTSKQEALASIRSGAMAIGMPFVSGRWVGGTLTNFSAIRGRVDKLLGLQDQREKGELSKYTKKEQLLIDRDITRLEVLFSGIVSMKNIPAALFVIDPGKEHIAVSEARKVGALVVALASSDCDVTVVNHPIIGNDSSVASITFFVNAFVSAYKEGQERKASAV